jgi:menaquinone-specific isochorismate synthase
VATYRVEELADAAGVAVDTVRYYQRRKLLRPPQRVGRVAIYDDAHLDRIGQIRALAERGFTLAQIEDLSADGPRGAEGQAGVAALLADLAAQNAPDPDLDKAELARRAEVPEFIVDIVVGAGLLVPSGPDDDRFPADAIDMLVAARTLVSEGVTLEELTALAMRHATHVEDVIDDAIELFKRHSDRRGGSREDLIGLMHRLVPVASDLVGRHFERTLRARALARMGDDPAAIGALGGGLLVVARRLEQRRDPISIYAAAHDHHRALWIRPDRGMSLVGLGAVEVLGPIGDGRFSAASAARSALAARVQRTGPGDAPAPVLLGGFGFGSSGWGGPGDADVPARGPDWSGFPETSLILPELTFVDRADGTWVLAAARVEAGADERSTIEVLDRRLAAIAAEPPTPLAVDLEYPHGEIGVDDPSGADYEALVAAAVAAIAAGEFGKVVLARTHEVTDVDPIAVLARLRERYPGCATFSFAVGDREFLGASPEELVSLDGRMVRTAALAGTTGVGWDDTTDEGLAAEMLASPKIRAEHAFVVDDITQRLAALGLVGETPAEPEVLRLARLQHLRTPITARIERRAGGVSDMDVLRVAGVLHPTPAVAGTPTIAAVAWLQAREAFDRGWYAAPVGWCDLDGNGELRVALRSALVDSSTGAATLFAGAGIVADSVPADELAETSVKLRALLDVMHR